MKLTQKMGSGRGISSPASCKCYDITCLISRLSEPQRERIAMPKLHPLTLAIGLTLAPCVWSAPLELETSLIRASALATPAEQLAAPVAVLEGDRLVQRREATLGDSL